jgi:hypothetical protein
MYSTYIDFFPPPRDTSTFRCVYNNCISIGIINKIDRKHYCHLHFREILKSASKSEIERSLSIEKRSMSNNQTNNNLIKIESTENNIDSHINNYKLKKFCCFVGCIKASTYFDERDNRYCVQHAPKDAKSRYKNNSLPRKIKIIETMKYNFSNRPKKIDKTLDRTNQIKNFLKI